MPQLARFSNGGFVLHKISLNDNTYSAWFNRVGNLLDCEQLTRGNLTLPNGQAVPLRCRLVREYLQTIGLRYVEQS